MTGAEMIRKALDMRRTASALPAQPPPPVIGTVGGELASRAAEPQRPRGTRRVPVDAAYLRRQRILMQDDSGAAAQAFKILRTQVLQLMRRDGCSSLAIVSPSSSDGRTVTAINLAASIADDPDHTALLVDLDLRRPGVHKRFGITVETGVDSCLRGLADVAEVLVQPERFRNLTLLPAALPVSGSAELLAADGTRQLTRELNSRYANRVVLYDLPPLLETADSLAFLPCVDAALLVVCEGRTSREDVMRSLQLMRHTPVVGTVLTGSREPRGL